MKKEIAGTNWTSQTNVIILNKYVACIKLFLEISCMKLFKFVERNYRMNTTVIRKQLHEYIDSADDKKVEAIFTIFQADITNAHSYTDDELKLFHTRREQYLKEGEKAYSVSEAHNQVRQNA